MEVLRFIKNLGGGALYALSTNVKIFSILYCVIIVIWNIMLETMLLENIALLPLI